MLTKSDLNAIDGLIVKRLDQKINPIEKRLNRLEKDVKSIITLFDGLIIKLEKRVKRIEDYLDLPRTQ